MTEKFNFDAPDCTCPYKDGVKARNMCGHVPPCPVYARWEAEFYSAQPAPETPKQCGCIQCLRDHDERNPCMPSLPAETGRMVVCAICGNKRCPHATNHRHECTHSNAPGQHGSIYGDYEP